MIIDAHCDVLWKLWENPERSFFNSSDLQVNFEKWMRSPVKVQCFAIFVPETVAGAAQFDVALEMVQLFKERIIDPYKEIVWVKNQEDILSLAPNERGAVLTLEGCHPISDQISRLKTLIQLGVRAVGLTWNQGNAVADGVGESRGAGLTDFGKEVVYYLNQERIWTDVSHVSYKGFWDAIQLAEYPMASHSNAYAVAPHPRNLDDAQLRALIEKRAFIGVTYVTEFLNLSLEAFRKDVVRHMKHIINLGGENSLGFGSDFDGTDKVVTGLEDYTDYESFISQMVTTHFKGETVKKVCYENFIRTFPRKI
ncbi:MULTISPECIES: dipeptidase [Pontibacillus]|uniref:Dipeptidase n=1 Tax=Pontibacillus chungwhensis TaxID=265426 RepID=A0ABY8V3N6_9BACI|nr:MULTISPECIES: dipeptidase [Pontibacillus]MCD5322762.1 dipeptidase [Pontibacillus sp. HN14]WIG00034.1 dipeptidase [Pontibacillus chungwhensis]